MNSAGDDGSGAVDRGSDGLLGGRSSQSAPGWCPDLGHRNPSCCGAVGAAHRDGYAVSGIVSLSPLGMQLLDYVRPIEQTNEDRAAGSRACLWSLRCFCERSRQYIHQTVVPPLAPLSSGTDRPH